MTSGAGALRVGYVTECYPTFIVNEVAALRKLGAHVTLLAAFRPVAEADPEKDALRRESRYFPPRYAGVVGANLRFLATRPLAYLGLAGELLLRRESLRLLVLAAYHAGVVLREGLEHLHATFGTRTTTLALATARLAGIDYSFSTHAYDVFNANPSLVWKTAGARFMRTIADFNRSYLLESYPGLDAAKIRVLHLGVDTKALAPANGADATAGPPRLLSVASLIRQKGHAPLLEALALLAARGLRLPCELIGEGPQRAALEEQARSLGLADSVAFLGNRPHAEVRQRLAAAQLFVLPCIDLRGQGEHVDGIPVALMEAMAMGLAVVSTRVSGIPELIEDGVSGLLVPERDAAALAEALARLAADAALRASLGRAARRRVEERFDLETNTARLAELLRA